MDSDPTPGPGAPLTLEPPVQAPATILVVDDYSNSRVLAEAILEGEGHRVILAEGGATALGIFEEHEFDCVILDLHMPGMNGFELCHQLRQSPAGAEVPILFLTNVRDLDACEQARQLGADDFLTKPVCPSQLLLRVHAALELRRRGAELREQRARIAELQQQREQILRFLTHDLKEVVESIDLSAQLVSLDELGPRGRQAVAEIRGEARALERLSLALLDP